MTISSEVKKVAVSDLHFDRSNPRLAEYGIKSHTSDDDILRLLWDAMDVRELVQSIAASGFFPHEPLIIAVEDNINIVIEGNRRLAAVKVLLNGKVPNNENDWKLPELSTDARNKLLELPITVSNREDSWRFLGFKHVNGPAKWSSYAKAKYIASVHNNQGISLADIANQIGDRHRTVQRLYRGLMVLEQAERAGVYDREDRFRQRLAFSHLYTGLDYEGISSFIGLEPEIEESINPVSDNYLKRLGEFLVWLYGSKKSSCPPVIESQNPHLRQLDSILGNREALNALRAGESFPSAYEISRPSATVFEDALLTAKRALSTARAHLSTGYDNSEDLLRIAGTIANMADDLYKEMDRKCNNTEYQSRLTEK